MPNSSTMLMRPESLCEMPIFLLVFVCSAPPNFEERNAIRESWAMDRNISNTLVRVYFLMGQTFDMSLQVFGLLILFFFSKIEFLIIQWSPFITTFYGLLYIYNVISGHRYKRVRYKRISL